MNIFFNLVLYFKAGSGPFPTLPLYSQHSPHNSSSKQSGLIAELWILFLGKCIFQGASSSQLALWEMEDTDSMHHLQYSNLLHLLQIFSQPLECG